MAMKKVKQFTLFGKQWRHTKIRVNGVLSVKKLGRMAVMTDVDDLSRLMLVGNGEGGNRTGQGFDGGLSGFFRRVVLFTQVGQNYMKQAVVNQIDKQIAGVLIGQMAFPSFDTLFEWPWVIFVFNQHHRIMV